MTLLNFKIADVSFFLKSKNSKSNFSNFVTGKVWVGGGRCMTFAKLVKMRFGKLVALNRKEFFFNKLCVKFTSNYFTKKKVKLESKSSICLLVEKVLTFEYLSFKI